VSRDAGKGMTAIRCRIGDTFLVYAASWKQVHSGGEVRGKADCRLGLLNRARSCAIRAQGGTKIELQERGRGGVQNRGKGGDCWAFAANAGRSKSRPPTEGTTGLVRSVQEGEH